jgi:uncharacterized protein YycO
MKRSSHQRALRLLAVASLGTTAFLLYWKSRDRAHKRQDASYGTPETSSLHPQPGDLLLFHNARGLNRLITTFTGSPFYHVALYVSKDKAVEATLKGVGYRELRGKENSYVVVPAPKGHGRAALAWAQTQIGAAYDRFDLVVIVLDKLFRRLHLNYTSPGKYSCGEFVETAFDKAGVRLVPDHDLDDVVPGDYARYVPPAERRAIR